MPNALILIARHGILTRLRPQYQAQRLRDNAGHCQPVASHITHWDFHSPGFQSLVRACKNAHNQHYAVAVSKLNHRD